MTMTRKPYHKELALAVENGDSTGVGRWLARGASPDSVNDVGQPVLTLAAATGQTRSVMALLAAGAQVDIADGSCLTALHLAVVYGHLATAECLLAGGADLNAQIMSGRSPTPLHSAVIADSSAGGDTRVRFLLARGADIGCCAYVGLGAIGARGDAVAQALAQPGGKGAHLAQLLRHWHRMQDARAGFLRAQAGKGAKLKL